MNISANSFQGATPIVDTRYGPIAVPEPEHDIIAKYLSRYGEWGWDEVGFLASVLPNCSRVLDGGAFVGTFGLGLALRGNLDFLCAVEANSIVAPLLSRNAKNIANIPVVVVEAMLAGPGTIPHPGRCEVDNLGSTSFSSSEGVSICDPPARVVTLAELRAEHGEFNLIKLDVEGMEYEILEADANYLSGGRATLWVECNENYRSLEVAELMLSWDLEVYYFAFPAHNPQNLRNDAEPFFPFAYEAGLLAAPKSRPRLNKELVDHRCILRAVRSRSDLKDALWRTPRWGMPEWTNAAPEELAALAGRTLRGEAYETYLAPNETPADLGRKTIGEKLDITQALSEAQHLAYQRLDEISIERERRERAKDASCVAEDPILDHHNAVAFERQRADLAERALADANALALERLSQIGAERERATTIERAAEERLMTANKAARQQAQAAEAAAEIRIRAAEAVVDAARQQARVSEEALSAICASTVWRLATPVHHFIDARPWLHPIIRRIRKSVVLLFSLSRR